MNLNRCRPNDTLADAQALLGTATTSIQGLWQRLGCPRRQVIQSSPQAFPDTKHGMMSCSLTGFSGLPEVLKAHVLEFSGNTGSLSLSLACQELNTSTWQSKEVWQARLASIGATASADVVADLKEKYRWHSCGIDALCRQGQQPVGTSNYVTLLGNARRAVRALVREDAPFMDLISSMLGDLIRWYDSSDDSVHQAVEGLLQDINSRSFLFTSEHMRSLSSAFDSACLLREMLLGSAAELAAVHHEDWDEHAMWDDLSTYDCWELLTSRADNFNEDEHIPEVSDSDEEACERMMEVLRSLREAKP